MATIRISSGAVAIDCTLLDTESAKAILSALPLQGRASLWGDEVYFSVPVELAAEPEARDLLNAGEIAYWPPGKAICLCWGPTPASSGNELRLASAANVFATTKAEVGAFSKVNSGDTVTVELID